MAKGGSFFGTSLGLLKQTFSEWLEDKAPQLGAALAYYTVFPRSAYYGAARNRWLYFPERPSRCLEKDYRADELLPG